MSVIGSVFIVQSGLFSYELILLGFGVLILAPALAASLYVLLFLAQILFAFAPAYHLSLESLDTWLFTAISFPPLYVLGLVLFVSALWFVFYSAALSIRTNHIGKLSYIICWTIVFVFAVFVDRIVEPKVGFNLVTSIALSTLQVRAGSNRESDNISFRLDGDPKIESATEGLFGSLAEQEPLPKNIVLVVAESLGLGSEQVQSLQYKTAIADTLAQDTYSVEYKKIPFRGSTIPGEYRELCGRMTADVILHISQQEADSCLPTLLSNLGYKTSAYHGYSAGFFDRIRLYKELGFEERLFANELITYEGLSARCGFLIFEGLCDSEIISVIDKKLSNSNEKEFIYWLTLNGHQPVKGPPARGTFVSCDGMRLDKSVHCWTIQHAQVVFISLLEVINKHQNTMLIIVGDHSPGGLGLNFSSDYVPSIVIKPKNKL